MVVGKLLERNAEADYGYNAANNTYEDLVKAGIIDPLKVCFSLQLLICQWICIWIWQGLRTFPQCNTPPIPAMHTWLLCMISPAVAVKPFCPVKLTHYSRFCCSSTARMFCVV